MSARRAIALLALLAACSAGEQGYRVDDLEHLVLDEGPRGTTQLAFSAQTPEEIARDDPERRERFGGAGLVGAFEASYVASAFEPGAPDGFLLSSRAYLFEDPDAGLAAIRATVEAEGEGLRRRGSPVDGRAGFTLEGTLDENLPPGMLLAWVKRNVVLVIAAVADDGIDPAPLRRLASEIDGREPPKPGNPRS